MKILLGRLVHKEERQLHVVSVVGMGGLGKATLAKQLYKHAEVGNHFQFRAWAFLSQQCIIRDVLQEIIENVTQPSDEEKERMRGKKEEELVKKLFKILKGKRYLIVVDDAWKTDYWDRLKPAFPDQEKGSKIILTTRNKGVGQYADT
uniref:NB-ARC domain-containing protein n=1 Tax=Nelumbo nucifera TaxID=4432 RepID=A0A822XWM5_NELNU|nr:TPA_asm: hypothetical protein HUJ06_025876 [Nelumbo nucifera]